MGSPWVWPWTLFDTGFCAGVGLWRTGWDDIGLAVQSGDEPVRACSVHGRAQWPRGDSDVDRESAVLGFHGQDDTGEWVQGNLGRRSGCRGWLGCVVLGGVVGGVAHV